MKTYKKQFLRGLVTSMAVWATACSNVSFTPSSLQSGLDVPDGSQKETFNFDDDGVGAKVDILFVVDNSPSMIEEQKRLGAALQSFITSIGRIDWQIAITTTDTSLGAFGLRGTTLSFGAGVGKILTKNVSGFETLFANTVERKEVIGCNNTTKPCPSSDEKPLEAISMAIDKRSTDNAGFFRSDADTAVIILSDEDEGSDGSSGVTPAQVVNKFKTAFGATKSLTAFGIIIEPGDSACLSDNMLGPGYYGTFAKGLADLTGGVTGSVCDLDYGPALDSIGKRVRDSVKTVTLKYTPNPETVQLIMIPFDSSLTWVIEGNNIRFSKPPKKGTRVDVVYLPKP